MDSIFIIIMLLIFWYKFVREPGKQNEETLSKLLASVAKMRGNK